MAGSRRDRTPNVRRTHLPVIHGWCRSVIGSLIVALGFVLVSGCSRWSCYELEFVPKQPDERWFISVKVTSQDENHQPAFAWMADEVAHGRMSGSRRGRWLVDDLWAMSKEHNVDPSAVRQPLFIIRGTPILIKPVNHCLRF
jgi:hypothetical protein